MKQYQVFELVFKGEEPGESQAVIDLTAEFENGNEIKSVKGFYAGNGIYKVRFLPQETGTYTWKVSGIVSGEGREECEVSEQCHGLVKAVGTHFEYEDGTRYIPFGTTIYALAHQTEELISETMKSLKASPFNKVRHCVFPKDYDYNHNEPPFYAFEKDENAEWIRDYQKPVIYDECCYEGDLELEWGNISAKEMVSRFWRAYCVGAYATHGETFLSEDEILWWAKGGK